MAQYRGSLRGSRGEANRLGSKASGLIGDICGWNGGIQVVARSGHVQGFEDVFDVYITGGSNNMRDSKLLASLIVHKDGAHKLVLANAD